MGHGRRTRDEAIGLECEYILKTYGAGGERMEPVLSLIERQLAALHSRAQILLGFCGIVITTTGFSGRLIAGTSRPAQWCVVLGVTLVLAAAATMVRGALQLRWMTQQTHDDPRETVMRLLAYRERKTRAYAIGMMLMLAGLCLYVASIAMMLFAPQHAPPIGPVR